MPETIYNQSTLPEAISYQKIVPDNPKEPDNALVQMRSILETGTQQNQSMNEITEKIYQLTLEHPELVMNNGVPETFEGIKNGIVKPYYEATRPGLGTEYFEFQVSEEELTLYDKNGNIVEKHAAKSGPYGDGALPTGEYGFVAKPRDKTKENDPKWKSFCDPSGNCWSEWLKPKFQTDRKNLSMHPDGNKPGTEGCIGVKDHETESFREALAQELTENPQMKLWVRP